jgi:hypothetical protein
MSKLIHFLKTLDDFELAQFYRYRYNQFMPRSKEKILAELNDRAMKINELEHYTKKENISNEKSRCPRCHSTKFYTAIERETLEFVRSTIEVNEYYKTCLVCLYSAEKPENYESYRRIDLFEYLRVRKKAKKS